MSSVIGSNILAVKVETSPFEFTYTFDNPTTSFFIPFNTSSPYVRRLAATFVYNAFNGDIGTIYLGVSNMVYYSSEESSEQTNSNYNATQV